ncbi:MAG: type II toxin-antitoxin system RelE/ParE family toxin [bacterium]|nr:type II toxin-antitoxin system RelE/ParE family toxin [bacterium]
MRRYILSPEAREDLIEIAEYIAQDSPKAARQVMKQLRSAMMRLAEMPGIGHLREDLTDEPLRFWPVFSYLIIYRPDRKPLEVVRVLHGARDVSSILARGF